MSITTVVLFNSRKGSAEGEMIPWIATGASRATWSRNTTDLSGQIRQKLKVRSISYGVGDELQNLQMQRPIAV